MSKHQSISAKEEALLATASNLYTSGKLEDARRTCKQAITLNRNNPDANHLIGIIYFKEGRLDIARKHLQRAAQDSPLDATVHCNLGLVLTAQGKLHESIAAYNKALEIEPDFPEARYQVAMACGQAGENEAAIRHYRELIRQHPDFITAYNNLGNLLARTGEPDAAIEVLGIAIHQKNADHLCFYNLANVYHSLEKYSEAIDFYKQAIRIKKDFHQAYLNIGHILEKLGRWDEEFQLYSELGEVFPNLPEMHDRLGTAYMRRGNLAVALREFDRALELNPDMVNTICSKAELLERTREYDTAAGLIEKALALDPDSIYAQYISGKLLHQKGEIDNAIEILEKTRQRSDIDRITSECSLLLGQLYARTGEYGKSFNLINEGNKIIASGLNNVDSIKEKFIDELDRGKPQLDLFSAELKDSNIPEDSNGSELVFIVGFPRSGTTLLDVMLESHPEIQTVEEKPAAHNMYSHFIKEYTSGTGNPVSLTPEGADDLRSVYFQELYKHADKGKTRLIIDKFPLNISRAHLIWRIFPAARFILALRHPCDTCLSCLMQNFNINSAMANFLTLKDTTHLYAKVMNRWLDLTMQLPVNHYSIKYESLINDFQGEIKSLLDFLGLEWDENILSYGEHSNLRQVIKTPSYKQVREPIYKHAVHRWEKYREFMEPDIEVLKPFIKQFGY